MNIQNNIQRNISLAPYTAFHIGGVADYFCNAKSTEELVQLVRYATEKNIPFFLLGQGANILVGDKGFRGLVIKNEAKKFQIPNPKSQIPNQVFITAESGITIEELINKSSELGLSGLEHYAGIPSSLGGALWQNLHFLSPDRTKTVFIADIVQKAEIVRINQSASHTSLRTSSGTGAISSSSDKSPVRLPCFARNDGKKDIVDRSYFKFDYDYSILHDNHDIVLSATLCLQKENKERIIQTIQENLAWRNAKHPKEAWKKSAGSVFKKIEEHGAGRIIEQAGLKGKQIGGAQISEIHANFIINTGNASAKDVRNLITLAQTKVKERFGLNLETEISFVGEF